jgi:hypothetical protein
MNDEYGAEQLCTMNAILGALEDILTELQEIKKIAVATQAVSKEIKKSVAVQEAISISNIPPEEPDYFKPY